MRADGSIVQVESGRVAELRAQIEAGGDPAMVEVPEDERAEVQAMNRHDRRKWFAEQRRARRKGAKA